jgi:hypothetical protein
MASIVIRNFRGIAPIMNPRLLPDGMATIALNTKLVDGTLGTWRGPVQVATITKGGTKRTIYRFGQLLSSDSQYWFSWTTDVDVVRAPIDNDTSERTYFTGDSYPKVTDNSLALGGTDYPVASYRLGVPQPVVTSTTVTVTGVATDPDSTAYSTAYVITNVDVMGQESMPSAPLGPVTFKAGQTVEIRLMPTAPGGNYNITAKRIYRSSTGTSGTAYQYVAEVSVGTTSYDDAKTPDQLGETASTWNWDMLPAGATGLVLMANGIGVAFENNELFLSEPYALYAYPAQYQLSTDSPIVGLGVFGQSVFVGTRANPYVLTGVDPSAMSFVRLDQNQACSSKRSIVSMMGGVIYATPDGLWLVDNGGMRSLSDALISRDQWQTYNPSSFHSYELDGRYIAFFDTGGRTGGLVFDFARGNLYEISQHCTAAYNDPLKDKLFMSLSATNISSWDSSSNPLVMSWKSKIYRSPDTVDMGYAKVESENYPLTLRVMSSGVTYGTYTVMNNKPFRIRRARVKELQIEIEASGPISAIVLAESGAEIRAQ